MGVLKLSCVSRYRNNTRIRLSGSCWVRLETTWLGQLYRLCWSSALGRFLRGASLWTGISILKNKVLILWIFININLILKKYFTLQLNPFSEGMYKVLNDVFEEYLGIFHYDAFHVGGDEVSVPTFAVNIRYICLNPG